MTGTDEILDNRPRKKFVCGVVEGFYGRPWTTEQRKTLFGWLKKMGLSTYMYAPKDDCKHRAFWRDLYSVEEAENLAALIEAARDSNVEFVYALSPGLDITFSSTKDVQFLKRKFEQVSSFGCSAFALLFDDIEPELSETDKSMFQSFGSAQVSVTNEVFQHLGESHFYFCPTEYCSSRAVPNLSASDYLNTIGAKLLPDIDILWTGQKVISKKITVQHLQDITAVLRRPPVIWDNIHANDYDPRRLFLGPYDGRSPEVIPYLRGVLTNPNCEFESNYIALHTLGQWAQSNADGVKKDIILTGDRLSPVVSDIKLETENEFICEDDFPGKLDTRYQPRVALNIALKDWLVEAKSNRLAPKVIAPVVAIPNIPSVEQANNINNGPMGVPIPPYIQPPVMTMNSLVHVDSPILSDSDADSTHELEPMEYVPCSSENGTIPSLKKNNSSESLMQVEVASDSNTVTALSQEKICVDNDACMTAAGSHEELDKEDLDMLVDFFYTPFDYGPISLQMLNDLHWLKCNSHLASRTNKVNPMEATEWMEKAKKFTELVSKLGRLISKLQIIPNTALTLELFPYLWDLQGVLQNCSAYVQWLGLGLVQSSVQSSPGMLCMASWSSKSYKEAFMSGDQEPWVFRGGAQGEFQGCANLLCLAFKRHGKYLCPIEMRLLPCEGAQDLFIMRPPEVALKKTYRYRPYRPTDEEAVYNVCLKTCDDSMDGTEVFPDMPHLIGDRIIGGIVTLSSDFCFVVEDDEGVCGYVVAALDCKELQRKSEVSWIPALCEKYPKPDKDELSPGEEVILSFHNKQRIVPDAVSRQYPSVVRVDFIPPRVEDYSIPKRLLACALTSLKTRGSVGLHVEMNVGDKCMIDHYQRMGFLPINTDVDCDDVVYLGRII